MLLVLCFGLIFNQILMTTQVHQNNFKATPSFKINRKVQSQTSFIQKLRNARKVLRKVRRNQLNMNVRDDFGYEDVSELLQYNYNDVWWTNKIPSTTTKPTTLSTVNVYHRTYSKSNARISTSNLYHSTLSTEIEHTDSKIIDTNETIILTKPTIEPVENNSEATENKTPTTKRYIRNEITTTAKPLRSYVSKRKGKGMYVPVFKKDENGQFSILANESDIFVKRNDNDTNMHASIKKNIFISDELEVGMFDFIEVRDPKTKTTEFIKVVYADNVAEGLKKESEGANIIIHPKQSAVLPSVVRDGIYRIELPNPVLKKTTSTNIPQFKSVGQQIVPPKMQPSQQMIDDALAFYNINRSQVPFLKENSGSFRPNYPQNGPGYFNQGNYNYRQMPFYSPYNLEQNGQAPYYNPPNPAYRQNYYGPYGQGPPYNPNNRPMPYMSNNFGPQPPNMYVQNPANRMRPLYPNNYWPLNPQNVRQRYTKSNLNLKPSTLNQDTTEHDIYINEPEHKRQGHGTTLADEVSPYMIQDIIESEKKVLLEGKEATTINEFGEQPLPVTEVATEMTTMETRSTFAEGFGPRKRTVHPHDDEIGPISPFVKELLNEKRGLKVGFFSMFLIKFFFIVARKEPVALQKFLGQAQIESTMLFDQDHFLDDFGEPFGKSFQLTANAVSGMPQDAVQSAAIMLHHAMVNRHEGVTADINSVIDYIDSLYEEKEGVDLFRVLEDINVYDKGEINVYDLYRKMSRVVFAPVRRLSGTEKRQILIESLNRVIENHDKAVPEDENIENMRRQGPKFHFKFTSVVPVQKKKVSSGRIKIYKVNDKRDDNPIKATKKRFIRKEMNTIKSIATRTFPVESVFKYVKSKKSNQFRLKAPVTRQSNDLKQLNRIKVKYNTNRIQNSNTNFLKVTTVIKDMREKSDHDKANSDFHKRSTNNIRSLTTFTTKSINYKTQNNNEKLELVKEKFNELQDIIADKIFKERTKIKNPKEVFGDKNNILKGNDMSFITHRVLPNAFENKNGTSIKENEYSSEEDFSDYFKENVAEPEMYMPQKSTFTVATTTPKPFDEKHDSMKLHMNSEEKKILNKPMNFHKREIKHLRHKHPKMYKKYLRHMKKIKHKGKRKNKSPEQKKKKSQHSEKKIRHYKKKSHHFKKKTNKKIKELMKIKHQYRHILKHHMVRKNLKDDTKQDRSDKNVIFNNEEIDNTIKNVENKPIFYPESNIMTNSRLLVTFPYDNLIGTQNIDTTTEKWIHLPIQTTNIDYLQQGFRSEKLANKSDGNSLEFFKLNITEHHEKSSSYSDEEKNLKDHLNDAMRHDDLRVIPQRRSYHEVTENKKKLQAFSSYSSEEFVLKSNIYKAVGFNNSRANFSDALKGTSSKKGEKIIFRSRLKPVNEMSSYSDDEDILKDKLYA